MLLINSDFLAMGRSRIRNLSHNALKKKGGIAVTSGYLDLVCAENYDGHLACTSCLQRKGVVTQKASR